MRDRGEQALREGVLPPLTSLPPLPPEPDE
jgi:hypothetical protein